MADQTIVPVEQTLSNKLFLIPLIGRPIFPGIFTPLMINAPEDVVAIEEAHYTDSLIGIVMLKEDVDKPQVSDMYSVGTVARIIKKINLPDGGLNIFISTIKRFKIKKVLNESGPMVAIVDYLEDELENNSFEIKALTRALISEMKEISENNPLFSEEMRLNMVNIDQPGKIADFITSILNIEKEEQQRVLEMSNIRQRMETVLVFIKKEQELLRIQKKIQAELNERIEKSQREYFLKEELKAIKEELGMTTDAKTSDYQKFKEKLASFNFEGEIKEVVESELEKFSLMDPNSGEFIVTRNYLETIANLPWKEPVFEEYNIENAQKILDEDHYGLEDVKKRIIEYLAVRKLKKDNKGSIILLIGPPGVGKTSLGRSIARSMNKEFFRFSVGGMRDEAEIKGHRRTYIGAMPGKIIQGLKIVKTKSPVFMIDEVDKISASMQGDPSSALLEVLDPEQNISFRDHYLDLPFDISNVVFILTANRIDSIPYPLLDRAEIIRLSGYIDQEKVEIAKKYLIPKSLEKNGLKRNQVKYNKTALLNIINSYAREAGVRNLEKSFDKIHRKYVAELVTSPEAVEIATKIAALKESETKTETKEKKEKETKTSKKKASPKMSDAEKNLVKEQDSIIGKSLSVDNEKVLTYLGKPIFDEDEIKKAEKPGCAIGLAWSSLGGDTLLIEAISLPEKEGLKITGKLGNVMKESANIALSWVKRYVLENHLVEDNWFEKKLLHIHFPEGATPKDGPSAGITIATAILSLVLDKTVKQNIAMTGELSLTGQVLPIGGLREKTVAAIRNKIKYIIIPKANLRSLEEIPEMVKNKVTFLPVSSFEEVIDLIF